MDMSWEVHSSESPSVKLGGRDAHDNKSGVPFLTVLSVFASLGGKKMNIFN